jgi:nucleotide-binding universal stress UspA family protein
MLTWEKAMKSITTILHPTDFSDAAQGSFQFACALASDMKARLIAFHVVQPAVYVHNLDFTSPDCELKAWECLRRLQQTAEDSYGLDIDIDLSEGEPAAEILKVAHDRHCDLIVMGTHGRTGLRHLLMGSIAEKVVRKADCPVLTARTPIVPESSNSTLFPQETHALISSF